MKDKEELKSMAVNFYEKLFTTEQREEVRFMLNCYPHDSG